MKPGAVLCAVLLAMTACHRAPADPYPANIAAAADVTERVLQNRANMLEAMANDGKASSSTGNVTETPPR